MESKGALDWLHRKNSDRSPESSTDNSDNTITKSGSRAESILDDLTLAANLAEEAFDAQLAPLMKPVIVISLLHNLINSYKSTFCISTELSLLSVLQGGKAVGEKWDLLTQRIVDLTRDICFTVLQMHQTNHSDQIGRLERDFERYARLIMKASRCLGDDDPHGFSGVERDAEIDELNQELALFGTKFKTNRLVIRYLNQVPNSETQNQIHDLVYNPHLVMPQSPVIICGGTGGPGGDANTGGTGGAGGTGAGPTVHFTNISSVIDIGKLEKWLQCPPDMRQKQHDIEALHMEGTSQWFFDSKEFTEWEDNAGVLWIEGPSGTGKSVLSSAVIQKLFQEQTQLTAHSPAVAFFYFDFRSQDTQSLEIALRRIVLQLSAQLHHPYEALEEYWGFSKGQKLPSYQDLFTLLFKLLSGLQRTYIVFDALDESGSNNFNRLVELVSVLQAWTETPVHLLITSQTRDIFTKSFADINHIMLHSNIMEKDIELFVANELRTNANLKAWQPNATLVTLQITRKANGM
ncbi:putative Ankyrin repeat and socs box protein [Mycena sanguinolenta]|uniref:Putative Ankyrin repeat and socs box protein n=1 Tax=Mycena sanguinolenta TaxID=230812 RepID=A0A8H6YLP3_9AGAR|nr:putative Ankyrin repeat and socs box protein [Mycena sanguinolenta]